MTELVLRPEARSGCRQHGMQQVQHRDGRA
jgi:hypothetical protein